jgi:UDP-3-O-[3-hydroxymyristoyl] glucosamine N-acyltransferase
MAGQVGVRDHVSIGAGATIGAMAGVSNDVAAGTTVLGAPAIPIRDFKVQTAAIAKLPQLRKQLKELAKQIGEKQAPALASGDQSKIDQAA